MNKLARAAAASFAAGVLALTGTASVVPAAVTTPVTAQAVDDYNDDWLHAKGSHLYDMNGNEVWITGVNWFGFNCGERFPHGLWSADIDELLSACADRGINTLRLPIATELLLDWKAGVDDSADIAINPKNEDGYKFNPDFCRPDGSCMDSQQVCDVIIQKCKKYGIKVFFDIHSPALHNSGHNYNLWYYNEGAGSYDTMAVTNAGNGKPVTTDMWVEGLVYLAGKYANDDTVIAYDLKNEPHGKCPEGSAGAKWDGSTDENNWAYAATQCAMKIFEVNPNALILVEGVEQYPREGHKWGDPDSKTDPPAYGGWWGGQFRGVRDYPLDFGKFQDKLMYSPHDYGPSVYAQTWFDKDFTEQTLLDDYWYDTWAFINEEDIAPLLIGEWGGFMDGGVNQKWMELLREYMVNHHINHTFWCLNPNSGDTGGLVGYDFKTWDEEKYELFEKSLWQTKSGKYISLDHQVALGKNGISLNDFYSNYASSEGSNLDGGKTSGGKPVDSTPGTKPTEAPKPTDAPTEAPKPTDAPTEAPKPTQAVTEAEPDPVMPTAASNSGDNGDIMYGDANCDGEITIADATAILQHCGNRDKYGLKGQAALNADCYNPGDGISAMDALSVQKVDAKILSSLPEMK